MLLGLEEVLHLLAVAAGDGGASTGQFQDVAPRHLGARHRRFEIARQTLLAGAPGTTVAGVVASLGFASGGRFSVEYKTLFEESPSEPLAASRGPAEATTKRSPRER
nr:helix-turn-helix domain-containing protein [Corallococcus carmarthensis]